MSVFFIFISHIISKFAKNMYAILEEITKISVEKLKKFFEERPALKYYSIGVESGLSGSHLGKIISGERPLSQDTINKLLPVIKKYGYTE